MHGWFSISVTGEETYFVLIQDLLMSYMSQQSSVNLLKSPHDLFLILVESNS